jgi:hypothetical protein
MPTLKENSDKELSSVESKEVMRFLIGFLTDKHIDNGLIFTLQLFVKIIPMTSNSHKRRHVGYPSITILYFIISTLLGHE